MLNFAAILPQCYTLFHHSHMNLHTLRMKTGQRGILLGGWAEMSAAVLEGEEDSEELLAYCKDSQPCRLVLRDGPNMSTMFWTGHIQ